MALRAPRRDRNEELASLSTSRMVPVAVSGKLTRVGVQLGVGIGLVVPEFAR